MFSFELHTFYVFTWVNFNLWRFTVIKHLFRNFTGLKAGKNEKHCYKHKNIRLHVQLQVKVNKNVIPSWNKLGQYLSLLARSRLLSSLPGEPELRLMPTLKYWIRFLGSINWWSRRHIDIHTPMPRSLRSDCATSDKNLLFWVNRRSGRSE